MKRIGILYHPKVAESQPLADKIEAWLDKQQIGTWQASSYNDEQLGQMVGGSDFVGGAWWGWFFAAGG